MRAVAVLSVILYHAQIWWIPGGFAGVDIFFVISGYLITTLLLNDMAQDRFSLLQFYERRARRILPALVTVVLATVLAAILLLTPSRIAALSDSVIWVSVFLSNFHFADQSGYFGPGAHQLPLLHTWSLAVEEQFYLLFPLALHAMRRRSRRAKVMALVAAILVSFFLAEVLARVDAEKNFFFTLSRFWELLAGALVALLPNRGARAPALGWLGLALVVLPLFAPPPGMVPGGGVMLPVIGTALVLQFAGAGTSAARLLSWGPFRAVGLISYSAYLWHQPVFVLARVVRGAAPSPLATATLILLILALSTMTWRLVEQPFRGARPRLLPSRRSALAAAVVASVGLFGLGLAGKAAGGWPGLWGMLHPDLQRELTLIEAVRSRPALPDESCRFASGTPQADEVLARLSDCRERHGKGILVLGDSHAIDLFTQVAQLERAPFIFGVVQGGCRPHSPDPDCPYQALPALVAEGYFELAIYEQAGFYLLTTSGHPEGSREMIDLIGLSDPVPDLQVNLVHVEKVRTYLESLAQAVPVVWFGPRTEPHIPPETLLTTGCGHAPPLRPGLAQAFGRLDLTIGQMLSKSTVHYLSQNRLFAFVWPGDFADCDGLWWRDGDHLSELGGLHFGRRADVIAAARAVVTAE
ncbi:acyltransferase family protein [Tabrizicola soli]|uniref:Acyltransferase family protein n=1 Tax=Tabrizicola soli TaxID=2185115 RepID=A0ABV7DTH3_9RHOB|nr:acyltransferase [Tabrizicola soli]